VRGVKNELKDKKGNVCLFNTNSKKRKHTMFPSAQQIMNGVESIINDRIDELR
jgi:hypothetical protein